MCMQGQSRCECVCGGAQLGTQLGTRTTPNSPTAQHSCLYPLGLGAAQLLPHADLSPVPYPPTCHMLTP